MCFIEVLVCVSTCCFVPDMIDQLLSSIYHDITCQECLAGANVCCSLLSVICNKRHCKAFWHQVVRKWDIPVLARRKFMDGFSRSMLGVPDDHHIFVDSPGTGEIMANPPFGQRWYPLWNYRPRNRPKPRRKHSSSQPRFSSGANAFSFREVSREKLWKKTNIHANIESNILNLTEDLPTFDGCWTSHWIVSARWNSVVCVGSLCLLGWGATADRHVLLIGHGEPTEGMCCNLDSDLLVVWCFLGWWQLKYFLFSTLCGNMIQFH